MKMRNFMLTAPFIALVMSGLPLSVPAAPAAESAPLTLKSRIALPNVRGRMDHLSVDLKGQRLFATGVENNTVQVIDLQAGRQSRSLADFDEPQGAFYDPSTNRLFIAS